MSTLSGATRSPDAMSRKNTVATLIALQGCTERHRTVVVMCSAKVGSKCAKSFSDVLAAVGPHVLLSDGSLFRGRLNSLTKISPPQSGFVLLFFCSRVCVCACVTLLLLVGEVVRCLRRLERTCLGAGAVREVQCSGSWGSFIWLELQTRRSNAFNFRDCCI